MTRKNLHEHAAEVSRKAYPRHFVFERKELSEKRWN